MKRYKRLFAVMLSLVMTVSLFAGIDYTAFAGEKTGTTGDLSWTFNTDTGELKISGNGRSAGYNTNTNRTPWYQYRSQIVKVTVEYGVIELGSYLFYACSSFTEINIPNSCDTIGTGCFRGCSALSSFKFPSGCSWFYDDVFEGCRSLKWVIMPDYNWTNYYSGTIPDKFFYNCTGLEEVYVGKGMSAVGSSAFYGCTALTSVMWGGDTLNSVGNNAFYNVPSSCKITGNSSISSANTGLIYMPLTGTCSADTNSQNNLSYSLNPQNRELSFSGSGNMNSNPWSVYHYLINRVNFSQVDGDYSIMSSAFYGAGIESIVFDTTGELTINSSAFDSLISTTYWLNIPVNTVSIGSRAFADTDFNYITSATTSVNIASNAFTNSGYARFFAVPHSGMMEFVHNGRNNGNNWYVYCLDDAHELSYTVTQPTCTEQGYTTAKCDLCDADSYKINYVPELDHQYVYNSTDGPNFVYTCSRCGEINLCVDAVTVGSKFADAISHENDNAPYYQSNYKGLADVYLDGYVNAKDYKIIDKTADNTSLSYRKTTVNTSTQYQTMEGFGASACWWSQDVGGWDNLDEVMTMLYDKEDGIGLDIYRYNLGAGSQDDTGLYNVGTRARCFLQADGTYNWNNDPNAMNALAAAKACNDDLKVTLFCNSPPVSLTTNGKAYCSMGADSNLDVSNYQAFTDYVLNCAEHFIDEGYNVTEVSPINEPEWGWQEWQNSDGSFSCNQEGCHWTSDNALNFYNNYFVPSIMNRSKLNGKVGVSIWESGQMNHNDFWADFLNKHFSNSETYSANNANIRAYVDSLDTHSYWASQADRITVSNQLSTSEFSSIQKVRCSEYCQMFNDGSTGVYDLIEAGGATNGMTIDYGIAMANIIYQDLTILDAVEWDWWTACGYGIYTDSLIYLDRNDHNNLSPSKRYYALGNFSKFIDDGAVRVAVSTQSNISNDVKKCAFLNPDGSVAIVYINTGTTNQYTYFDASQFSSLETYVTDEKRDLELLQSGRVNGRAVILPKRSVTTVVLR